SRGLRRDLRLYAGDLPREIVVTVLPALVVRSGGTVHQTAQEIDNGAAVHARAHRLGGQVASVGVQIGASKDAVDQRLPVLRRSSCRRAGALARACRRAFVAEVATQQLDDIVDQLFCFRLADLG